LADEYAVTRQIIVADIALLRAAGYRITAVSRGYLLAPSTDGMVHHIAVKHGKDDVENEFYTIVDNGGRVLDVAIEHTIYGRISAEMNIASRYDADCFVRRINEAGATPLSVLTEGIHTHAVAVPDEDAFARITARLSELGILIEAI
jgi:transcriptional regulator of NAD metabolism